jgi:hypothetical protein
VRRAKPGAVVSRHDRIIEAAPGAAVPPDHRGSRGLPVIMGRWTISSPASACW